jgi:Na+-transporting methylmalonyl-CoA/oxaloacetate decarboxylase gamma subunit
VELASILLMCGVAFVAVFVLLSLLALVMEGIGLLFPQRAPVVEPVVVAAVSSAVASLFAGARVTRIESLEEGP